MEQEVSIFMAVNYYKDKPEEYSDNKFMFVRDKREHSFVYFGISLNRYESAVEALNALGRSFSPHHHYKAGKDFKKGLRDIYDVCGHMLNEDLKQKVSPKFKNHFCEYLLIIKHLPDFDLLT